MCALSILLIGGYRQKGLAVRFVSDGLVHVAFQAFL